MAHFCGSFKKMEVGIDAVAPRRELTLEEARAPARKNAIERMSKLNHSATNKRRDFARKLMLEVGMYHYVNCELWGMSANWQFFHDSHCIVSSAMAIFHELVPSLISVNEAAAQVLTMRVRMALLACVFIAIKFESEDTAYLSCTKVSGLVLHAPEAAMFNGATDFCEEVFEFETRVLKDARCFHCCQRTAHRIAVELIGTMVARGDLGRFAAARALSVCFFLAHHTYYPCLGWTLEYGVDRVSVAFVVASMECAEVAGVQDVPPRTFSFEECAVARAILSCVLNLPVGIEQAKLGGSFAHEGAPDRKTTCSATLLLARERLAATAYRKQQRC